MARKTLTKKEKDYIVELFEMGISNNDVASVLSLTEDELDDVVASDIRLTQAKMFGVKMIEHKVTKSLLKLALGYEFNEVKTMKNIDKNNNIMFSEKTTTKKHVKPDMSAIKFYLENKCPESWKDGIGEVEKEFNLNISIDGNKIIATKEDKDDKNK